MERKQTIIVIGPYGPVGAPRAADSGRLPSNSISASANSNRANEVVTTATDSTTSNAAAAPIERPQASLASSSIFHARPIAQQLQVPANIPAPMQSYAPNAYVKHGNFIFRIEQAIFERLRGIAPFVIVQTSLSNGPTFNFVIETPPQPIADVVHNNSTPSAQQLRELQSRVYTVFDNNADILPIRVRFEGNIFKLDPTGSSPAVPQAHILPRDQSSRVLAVNGGGVGVVGHRVPTVAILQRYGPAAASSTVPVAAPTASVTAASAGAQVAPTNRRRKQNLKLLASPKALTSTESSEAPREVVQPGPSKPAAKRTAGNVALSQANGPQRAKQAKVRSALSSTLASLSSGGHTPSTSVQVGPNVQTPKTTSSCRSKVANNSQRNESSTDQEIAPIEELPEPISTLRGRKVKPTAKAVAAVQTSKMKLERRNQYLAKRNASASPTSSAADADAQRAAQQPVDPANVEYCWKCHLPGTELLHCSRCSLGWHNKRHGCSDLVFKTKIKSMIMIPSAMTGLATREMYEEKQQWVKELGSLTDHTVCIECARKEAGTIYNREYGFLVDMDANDQNYEKDMERCAAVYYYAVKSLMIESREVQNAATGMMEDVRVFASLVHIDYGEHVVPEPIDLNWIYEKTRRIDAYLCTEDFMLDIKKLCHSYLILQQKKGIMPGSAEFKSAQALVKELIRSADYELICIDRCESCYRQSFEVNTDRVKSDMVMPCEHCHAVVWMVHHNLWWPAKVYEYRQSEYYFVSENYLYVVPFGDEKAGKRTTFQALRTFSRDAPPTTDEMAAAFAKFKPDKQQKYRDAQEEGLADSYQYYRKYWNQYFKESYPVPKNSKEFTSEDLYVENGGLKKGKRTLDANFKLSNRDGADDDDDDDEGDNEPAPVVKRGRMSKEPKAAAVPSQRASTSRAVAVDAAAGPSNAVQGAKSSAEQSVNKEMPLRRSTRQTRK